MGSTTHAADRHKDDNPGKDFEVHKQCTHVKQLIWELDCIRNYGYKIREPKTPSNFDTWSEVSKARYLEKERIKMEELRAWDNRFLGEKRKAINETLTDLTRGIARANRIVCPRTSTEFCMRRCWQDLALGALDELRIHLQDIMDVLEIEKNWMLQIEPEIAGLERMIVRWKESDTKRWEYLFPTDQDYSLCQSTVGIR